MTIFWIGFGVAVGVEFLGRMGQWEKKTSQKNQKSSQCQFQMALYLRL